MKKKLMFLAAIVIFAAGCNNNEVVQPEPDPQARIIRFTASVGEPENSRATIEKLDDKLVHGLQFKWEENDEIQFCFEQGSTKATATTKVSSVTNDGLTAYFEVLVPNEIKHGTFTLYAYRSSKKSFVPTGSKLLESNPTVAMLPTNYYDYTANLEDQALSFSIWSKQDGIEWGENGITTPIALKFWHLGSMMTFYIKNTGNSDINNFYSLALSNPYLPEDSTWVYNRFGNAGAHFDMKKGEFVRGQESGCRGVIFYRTPKADPSTKPLKKDEWETLYLWFVPGLDIGPFNLNLFALRGVDPMNHIVGMSVAPKPSKIHFQTGKNYIYFAHIYGTSPDYKLEFKTPETW